MKGALWSWTRPFIFVFVFIEICATCWLLRRCSVNGVIILGRVQSQFVTNVILSDASEEQKLNNLIYEDNSEFYHALSMSMYNWKGTFYNALQCLLPLLDFNTPYRIR